MNTGLSKRLQLLLLSSGVSLVLSSTALAQAPPSPSPDHADNSGQDPTRPVTRLDVRLKHQDNPAGAESQLLTLRADKPFALEGGWKVSTRLDLPLVRSDTITAANLDGGYETGVGDLLVQALLIAPPQGKVTFAFGAQMLVPTGSDDQFTTGKWRLLPTAGAVYLARR
jgi:Putative MetA-pathway of phenol degradation